MGLMQSHGRKIKSQSFKCRKSLEKPKKNSAIKNIFKECKTLEMWTKRNIQYAERGRCLIVSEFNTVSCFWNLT